MADCLHSSVYRNCLLVNPQQTSVQNILLTSLWTRKCRCHKDPVLGLCILTVTNSYPLHMNTNVILFITQCMFAVLFLLCDDLSNLTQWCMIAEAKSDWFLAFCRILPKNRWELNTATVRLTLYDKSVGTGQMIGETWIWIKKMMLVLATTTLDQAFFKCKPTCIHG